MERSRKRTPMIQRSKGACTIALAVGFGCAVFGVGGAGGRRCGLRPPRCSAVRLAESRARAPLARAGGPRDRRPNVQLAGPATDTHYDAGDDDPASTARRDDHFDDAAADAPRTRPRPPTTATHRRRRRRPIRLATTGTSTTPTDTTTTGTTTTGTTTGRLRRPPARPPRAPRRPRRRPRPARRRRPTTDDHARHDDQPGPGRPRPARRPPPPYDRQQLGRTRPRPAARNHRLRIDHVHCATAAATTSPAASGSRPASLPSSGSSTASSTSTSSVGSGRPSPSLAVSPGHAGERTPRLGHDQPRSRRTTPTSEPDSGSDVDARPPRRRRANTRSPAARPEHRQVPSSSAIRRASTPRHQQLA